MLGNQHLQHVNMLIYQNLISPKAEKRGLVYKRIYKYMKGISREEYVR